MKKITYYLLACLLVSSALWAAPFIDNSDGTVTDGKTNLIWQKCSAGLSGTNCETGSASTQNWQTALTTCNGLSLAGKAWRLPSTNELLSIVDMNKASPAIDTAFFPATVAPNYWSSSTYVPNTTNAWFVDFVVGGSGLNVKPALYSVRCVSSGP